MSMTSFGVLVPISHLFLVLTDDFEQLDGCRNRTINVQL